MTQCPCFLTLALIATGFSPYAHAQTQGWYESNGDYWNRQSQQQGDAGNFTQQSMAAIRQAQAREAALSAAYAKRGNAVIAANRASTSFASSPGFSITSYLVKQAQGVADGQHYVPIIREQAEGAKRQFLASLAKAGYRQNDFVEISAFAAAQNAQILTGRPMSAAQIQRQITLQRQLLLKNPVFQGVSDLEKQTRVEEIGVKTVYALQLAQNGDPTGKLFARQTLRLILGRDATASELSRSRIINPAG